MSVLRVLRRAIPDRHPLRVLWHRMRGFLAALKAGFPAKKLKLLGITGTDGKTTTVGMTMHILRAEGVKAAAASTTFLRVLDDWEWNQSHKTSMDPGPFQKFLQKSVSAGCTHAVIECSSHGLVQGRFGPLSLTSAAITNTSPEHLDYHGTMEQYRKDKGILFTSLHGDGAKVLNADDGSYELYAKIPSKATVVYSPAKKPAVTGADLLLWATSVTAAEQSTKATLYWESRSGSGSAELSLSIPGTYNVENALAAVGLAWTQAIAPERSIAALSSFKGIPGRLEPIEEGQAFGVYVDFTVTPQAYEKALAAVQAMHPQGRLLVLTGSCGNRMPEKRPLIGEICSRLADVVVVTTDETITEDPLKVIDEVWAGITQSSTQAQKIVDRREAIRFLVKNAKPGDAVLLCGMGACQTMQTRNGLIPWDEREVAREELRLLK